MEKKPNFFKRHKKLTIVLIIVAVCVIALVIYIQKQVAASNAMLEAPPETMALERMNLENKVTASGNFASIDPVTLGNNVQGAEAEMVYVSVGDRVEAGDVLAVLKTADLKRNIADLQETIAKEAATDVWNRSKASRDLAELEANPNAPAEQLQAARDRLAETNAQDSTKQSRSQLKSLQDDLENASITSPISGIVTAVTTEAGKAANGAMFTVENTETLQISATIAEYDVIKVKQGMEAYVTSNALGSQSFGGVVDFVAPVASDKNGNFEVRVLLTSPALQLRPGMTATISIVTESKQNIFAVPIDAVVTRPDGKAVVYAYEPKAGAASAADSGTGTGANDTRREIEVTTGMETDYYIEISGDGLTEGLQLLADPLGKNVVTGNLADQMPVGMAIGGGSGGGAVRAERVESAGGGSQNVAIGG
ncbi:RND transporter [Clostridia bacterium]|nr:RND transporter [Clostridia bacterium]